MSKLPGLTVRFLKIVGSLALQPLITGACLILLSNGRFKQRCVILELIKAHLSIHPHQLIASLRALFVLGSITVANGALNTWATTNWRFRHGDGWDWQSEVAVVTGGCSGIGQKVAEFLADEGIRVAVLDVQDMPKDVKSHRNIHYFRGDISSETSVAKAAELIRQNIGHPTILVNNAGIAEIHSILDTGGTWLEKMFGVNVISHWHLVREFLPDMILRDKGHIVTMASMASFVTLPSSVDYSVTKAGLLAFHEGLSCEIKHFYKASGILTTIVHPGLVKTPMTFDHWRKVHEPQRVFETMWTAEDIARQVLQQIMSKRGGQLIIPRSMTLAATIRGWPNWMQEGLRDFAGRMMVKINRDSRYRFIGRKF
ncbi:hypothetical protein F5883DRAFT_431484 [Diaporthe sp. PMI_573]|nr:hypothetical protein F5883DRAFT_431484 [Diaporthaceae sp. PMI_573]